MGETGAIAEFRTDGEGLPCRFVNGTETRTVLAGPDAVPASRARLGPSPGVEGIVWRNPGRRLADDPRLDPAGAGLRQAGRPPTANGVHTTTTKHVIYWESKDGRRDTVSSMVDILAVFRVEHQDIALTRTAEYDPSATLRPIREAGTDPEKQRYLFSVTSEDFERFEAGLDADPTVADFERIVQLDEEAVYAFTYADDAILFSTQVGRSNGVVLDMENDGTTWVFKTWFPNRESAQRMWDFAVGHEVEISLDRINEHGSIVSSSFGLTTPQEEAILTALESGYFDEPRGATLGEVARELDISQPAASGLLRRGLKRLVRSTLAEEERQ